MEHHKEDITMLKLKSLLIKEASLDDLKSSSGTGQSDPSGQGQAPPAGSPEATGEEEDPKDVERLMDKLLNNQQMKQAVKRINTVAEITPAVLAFVKLINTESPAAGKMNVSHVTKIKAALNKMI